MEWTTEKIEAILGELDMKFGVAFAANDYEALGLCYHPDAVLVHKGVGVYHGRKAIQNALAALFSNRTASSEPANNQESKDPPKRLYGGITTDGEYAIRSGSFKFGNSSRDHPFEIIYKKVNGDYFIYYDVLDYSP
ncbi:hypothetical protein M3Y97_00925900 [Aphelenchoides bicaudatus]|nr:hypothetical protein M3Y97_00925900 [Aphelenchoides bicaudatus]